MTNVVRIWTDGSCLGNPGPGGWAAYLWADVGRTCVTKLISGSDSHTTNNRMELLAAISALEILKYPCHVTFYTDSKYLIFGVSSTKRYKKNLDLWKRFRDAAAKHHIICEKVAAHSGDTNNDYVDEIARTEAYRAKAQSLSG